VRRVGERHSGLCFHELDTIGPRVRKPGALFAEGVKRA
jgi:hypothetical protein